MRNLLRVIDVTTMGRVSASLLLIGAFGALGAQTPGCTIRKLGELAVVDTVHLRRVTLNAPAGESAEGGLVDIYYEGSTPRVVVASHFGETGKAINRFFLRDSLSFVEDREEVYYARPLGVGKTEVVSRVRHVEYYCKGRKAREEQTNGPDGPSVLAELLRRASSSGRR